MSAYYNEFDPKAAATLRELITEGFIAPGDVDERSIEDVLPSDLAGYTQVHLFAGFGIWSLALRRAGWPDARPVWTASCPCQPFSAAGKGGGFADDRHLWPAAFWLLQHGKEPGVPLYGEQVASPDGLSWLDLVRADLETVDHSVWSVVLASAGFGAPIIRQRSYWLARAAGAGWDARRPGQESDGRDTSRQQPRRLRDARGVECPASIGRDQRWPESSERSIAARRGALRLGSPNRTGLQGRGGMCECSDLLAPGESGVDGRVARSGEQSRRGDTGGIHSPQSEVDSEGFQDGSIADGSRPCGDDGRVAGTDGHGHDRSQGASPVADSDGQDGRLSDGSDSARRVAGTDGGIGEDGHLQRVGELGQRQENASAVTSACRPGPTNGFWRNVDWLRCRDDKWRPVEPGTFPLANGYPERMGILRGAGNAISPQVAAAWISVTM